MSEYIKLKDAIERTNQLFHGDEVEAWLKSLPIIDIVHCEDCENCDVDKKIGISRCCKFEFLNEPNDYCSYGERKEQEHE